MPTHVTLNTQTRYLQTLNVFTPRFEIVVTYPLTLSLQTVTTVTGNEACRRFVNPYRLQPKLTQLPPPPRLFLPGKALKRWQSCTPALVEPLSSLFLELINLVIAILKAPDSVELPTPILIDLLKLLPPTELQSVLHKVTSDILGRGDIVMQAECAKLLMELIPSLPSDVVVKSAHEGVKHLSASWDH